MEPTSSGEEGGNLRAPKDSGAPLTEQQRELVANNLKLVYWVIWRYRTTRFIRDLGREDAFQAGVIGLITAARRFDESRGLQFSTYAGWCIRGALQVAARTSRTIANPHRSYVSRKGLMVDLVTTHNETKDLDLEKIVSVPSHEEEIDNRLDVETYLSILSPKQKDRLERWKLCGVRAVGDQVGCSAQAAQQTIYLAISRIRRRFRRELREANQRPARRDDRDRGSEDRERLRDFAARPRNKAALGAAGVTS